MSDIWKELCEEYEPLFGRIFLNKKGEEYKLDGLSYDGSDYFYVLWNYNLERLEQHSCLGALERCMTLACTYKRESVYE